MQQCRKRLGMAAARAACAVRSRAAAARSIRRHSATNSSFGHVARVTHTPCLADGRCCRQRRYQATTRAP
eukprot:5781278-Prymnesium_polylepis.1